jgi:hypothetical protein
MKGLIKISIIAVLILSTLLAILFSLINGEKKKYIDKLGTTVVIGTDTATVIDYSTLDETLKLSNGKSVSFEFIENLQNLQSKNGTNSN